MKRAVALLTAVSMAGVCPSASFSAELPIREIVLYKHGIGFFERSGEIPAGESAQLSFKTSDMNDVLKSLTVQGGRISGLRYDASDPLSHRLADFPFRFDPEQPMLSAFLAQLKGARVSVQYGPDNITGTIVNARVVPGDEKHLEREQLILLTDTGEIRTLDLTAATSLKLEDAALQAKLREYLRVTAAGRSVDKRNVYIDSVDSGTRRVTAQYVSPTPVWKSSYRLIFKEGEPMLEGWAIVDNTTGEDWTKVQLALVSGRPISFVSQLYPPRYIERPTADLPGEYSQAPIVHEGAIRDARAGAGGVIGGIVGGVPAAAPPPPPPAAKAARPPFNFSTAESVRVQAAESTVAATAGARELGELFEYRFSTPVTVKAGESAMLPFLQQKIGARKLLIYSDHSSQHPTNAAELTNSTGKTLDGGPITVFDAGAYAGEALMETTKMGDKRLISYGTDLGTRITTRFDSDAKGIREIHARRGILTTRHSVQEIKAFTIRNVDQKPKTLIIEHPVREGYKLVNLQPLETTANHYRFEVKLGPAASDKFVITEEREYESSLSLVNMNPNALLTYVQNKALSDTGRKQLEGIADKKRRIADLDGEIRRTETDIANLNRDQERIRQNIGSLNQVTGQQEQVQRYARTLATQEGQLASLRDRVTELQRNKAALEVELNSEIEKLNF